MHFPKMGESQHINAPLWDNGTIIYGGLGSDIVAASW